MKDPLLVLSKSSLSFLVVFESGSSSDLLVYCFRKISGEFLQFWLVDFHSYIPDHIFPVELLAFDSDQALQVSIHHVHNSILNHKRSKSIKEVQFPES